ncbi:MAG: MFS transporter [Thermoplasmata archaeon]
MFDKIPSIHLSKKYRWFISAILVTVVTVSYLARMSVSVALPMISGDMGWTSAQKGSLGGVLMGIFLVGYGFSNIYFGRYVDRFGPRFLLVLSMITWSLALGMGALMGHIYWIFLFSRLLLGVGQGVVFPVASKVTGQWFSPRERGRANSIYMAGGPLGVMLAPLIMRPIIINSTWELSFYTLGLIGFALLIPVILFVTSFPSDSKKREENDESDGPDGNDLLKLVKDKEFQVILAGFIAMSSLWWGVTFWVPTYLVETQGLELSQMTFWSSFVYMGAVLSLILGSWISDITGKRKLIIVTSLFSASVMIVLFTNLNFESRSLVMISLFLVFFTGQLAPPLFFTLLQSKVPQKFLGSATGAMNGIGNGVSVIGPILVGFVIYLTGSYDYGLSSLAVIGVLGGIILLLSKNQI